MVRRLRVSLRLVVKQMARRPDLLCGAIVLGCSLLLALRFTCSRAKNVVAPARPPVRFFSANSPVVDLFLGQLDQVERLRGAADVSLVFYYAPWCGRSIAVRPEIEQVAGRLSGEVQFVAINCWWNQGKCRKQNNLYQYPVIHLYYRRFGPIEYKGPLTAAYVEHFVRRVIAPLVYLPSQARLQEFLSHYEPAVVGFFEFNASPQPPGYMEFLSSALQALKRDIQGALRFGVVTSKWVAASIPLRTHGAVYLHRRLNASLVFPRERLNFTADGVCRWALEHREVLLRWLRPHGGKSRLLDRELGKGAALLVFVPFDPLAEHQPLVEQVAEIAIQYHSCPEGPDWQSPQGRRSPPAEDPGPLCCNTVVLPRWHSISRSHNVCELCLNRSAAPPCSFLEMEAALDSFYLRERLAVRLLSRNTACSNILRSYSPSGYYSACCKILSHGRAQTSGPPSRSYPPTPFQPPPRDALPHFEDGGPPVADPLQATNVTGLRCRTNKTLGFYLLDSHLHWSLAERLGAPRNGTAAAFATIVDLRDEVHYILDQSPLIKATLEDFIRNYSVPYSPLTRHLRGSAVPPPAGSALTEVTTLSFQRLVMDQDKDVLLLYYTQWCGFCSALNHVLLQLARLLQGHHGFSLCRINAARNDLPWEFMVDRVPALLLFPRNRKAWSVKFPEDAPVTLPSLLRFLLHNTGPAEGERVTRAALLQEEMGRLRAELQMLEHTREQLSQHALHNEPQWQGQRLEQLSQLKQEQLEALAQASQGPQNTLQRDRGPAQAVETEPPWDGESPTCREQASPPEHASPEDLHSSPERDGGAGS
ncbi:thioredoxin domain-containing protein 11 [Amia ocellicauda]|uniref:thioredoxin domain-containing protein 11 n=1 Tax=Amia ocellicauda TaxID=2972642 RepID=UPI003464DE84